MTADKDETTGAAEPVDDGFGCVDRFYAAIRGAEARRRGAPGLRDGLESVKGRPDPFVTFALGGSATTLRLVDVLVPRSTGLERSPFVKGFVLIATRGERPGPRNSRQSGGAVVEVRITVHFGHSSSMEGVAFWLHLATEHSGVTIEGPTRQIAFSRGLIASIYPEEESDRVATESGRSSSVALMKPKGSGGRTLESVGRLIQKAKANIPLPNRDTLGNWAIEANGLFEAVKDGRGSPGLRLAETLLGFAAWLVLVDAYPSESGGPPGEPAGAQVTLANILRPVFPAFEDLVIRRPVDLSATELNEQLETSKFFFPMHVLEAICASLNSGKHLILTGPPGCGKTKLAKAVCRLAEVDPLVATASPSWSSSDLLGRYVPDGENNIRFQPGHFLKAIDVESSRWLVIDEFNRANIDECFGELFTVFAGDSTVLSFEERVEDRPADDTSSAMKPMSRLLPVRIVAVNGSPDARYRDYEVPTTFRLIGTMNDADRSQLHPLSFALLRRFQLVRVEAPPPDKVKGMIERSMNIAMGLGAGDAEQDPRYDLNGQNKAVGESLRELAEKLFLGPSGLLPERVVGVASVTEALGFVAEGMRPPPRAPHKVTSTPADLRDFVISWFAMAVVLGILPQFDALDEIRFKGAVRVTLDTFKGFGFCRLGQVAPGGKVWTVKPESAAHSGISDRGKAGLPDATISLGEYIADELRRHYATSLRHHEWVSEIADELLGKIGGSGSLST